MEDTGCVVDLNVNCPKRIFCIGAFVLIDSHFAHTYVRRLSFAIFAVPGSSGAEPC